MARDFQITGECLVYVKGRADSAIGALCELGLADGPINVSLKFNHEDIKVDAWGNAPPEIQWMLAEATVSMNLVHFDQDILDAVVNESMAGAPAFGQMRRAGARMGNNKARFAAGGSDGNHFIGLNLTAPVNSKPWRFYYAFLAQSPAVFPMGVQKQVAQLQWRVVPYTQDPWGGGTGAQGSILWDRVLDT
jgi:hypothetical protein